MTKKIDLIQNKIQEDNKIRWWKTKSSKMTGIIILIFFAIGFALWFFAFRPFVSTNDARINATIVNVANAGTSGQIQNIFVKEGDTVVKDMILAELDHRTAEALLQQAKTRSELAESIYKSDLSLLKIQGSASSSLIVQNPTHLQPMQI